MKLRYLSITPSQFRRLVLGLFFLTFLLYLLLISFSPSFQSLNDWSKMALYEHLVYHQYISIGFLILLGLGIWSAFNYQKALQTEKDYFLNALDQAALSIAIIDANRKVKWTNDNFEKWNGKTEVLEKDFLELTTNRKAAELALSQLAATNQSKQTYRSHSLKGRAVQTTINKLKSPKGMMVVMDADITDLMEANQYQKLLLAIIGHDTQETTSLKDDLALLLNEVENSFDLSKNLTDWGNLLIKRTALISSQYLYFQEELNKVIDRYELFLQHHAIALVLDYKTKLGFHADPDMLRAILRNLISNALAAILNQKELQPVLQGQLKISVRKENFTTKISVQDNGGGIPMDLVSDLFIERPEEEAISLGTMLCRKFVEAHNGKIFIGQPETSYSTNITFIIPPKKEQA